MIIKWYSLPKQLLLFVILMCSTIAFAQQSVTWTDLVNIKESQGILSKSKEVKTWWNAGAASLEVLPADTNGWIKTTVKNINAARILGLSSVNKNAGWDTIDYGFYLKGKDIIEILEKGKVILTTKIKYKKGDIIGLERTGAEIFYKHNEKVLYASKQMYTGDLIVDISMYSPKSTFQNVTISSSFLKKGNVSNNNNQISHVEPSPDDYKISNSNITIIKATIAVLNKINRLENKEKREVKLGKISSQEDFDRACEKLTWIKKLEVRNVKNITNVESFRNLKALEEFYFNSFKFPKDNPFDLEVLKEAKNLKEINFSFVYLKNTKALENIHSLEEVSFFSSGADDISFLKNNPKVKSLNLSGSKHSFSDYVPIASLEKLEKLNLPDTFSEKNSLSLGELKYLEDIELGGSDYINSLNFLQNSSEIRSIKASSCVNLKDIEALKGKVNIRSLDFYYCKGITSISSLKGLPKLNWLQLNSTNVQDLTPLEGASNLRFLDVADTQVTDISPLMSCSKLKELEIGKAVSKAQIDAIKTAIPGIEIIVK